MELNLPTSDFLTTTLQSSLAQGANTATVGVGLALPATNGVLQFNYDSTVSIGSSNGPETVTYATYDSGSGALAGITRGLAGTIDVLHDGGASVQSGPSILYFANQILTSPTLISPVNKGVWDGWVDPNETLTYASGTTITTPAGGLLKYSVGDKIKLNQSIPLTAYYPLISDANDTKGGFNGTATDITYTAGGKFGNAATFNGSSSKIVIADTANLKPTGAFTIECTFKTSNTGAGKVLFQSFAQATNNYGFHAWIKSTNVLGFDIGNNTSATSSTLGGKTNVCDGQLHHAVFSYQSNVGKIFLDGKLEISGSMPTPDYATDHSGTNYVRIGSFNTTGSDSLWMNGQIGALTFINGYAADSTYAQARYALVSDPGTANVTVNQYAYVTAVTDTLLTITGGADYALYNSTLSNPYYSHSNAVGFPQWFNWSPTINAAASMTYTAITVNKSRFCVKGREMTMRVDCYGTVGGTPSTLLQFTTPITLVDINSFGGAAGYNNSKSTSTWWKCVSTSIIGQGLIDDAAYTAGRADIRVTAVVEI